MSFLKKLNLDLFNIKEFILSPGDIYWKQKKGKLVLVSQKNNFLNRELIEKLANGGQELCIDNQFNLQNQEDFSEYFKNHKMEFLVQEKKPFRKKILNLLATELSQKEVSQFEINQITWTAFSKVSWEEAKMYIDEDLDLFKRSMSLTTSLTLCAFILGYYSDFFLSQLYTETFLKLMDFNRSIPVQSLKNDLENTRINKDWQDKDKKIIRDAYQFDYDGSFLIGERYDGTGIGQIKKEEMNDLEMLLISLNEHFSYVEHPQHNIIWDIKNALFKCDENILKQLEKCLKKESVKGQANLSA